jgi:hypothetical protein
MSRFWLVLFDILASSHELSLQSAEGVEPHSAPSSSYRAKPKARPREFVVASATCRA